jgi:hypothetical protein
MTSDVDLIWILFFSFSTVTLVRYDPFNHLLYSLAQAIFHPSCTYQTFKLF